MTVTEKLLKLFLVDKQLRGLQGRLQSAERFLNEQNSQLQLIDTKRGALEGQIRQATAAGAEHEGEAKRLEARMNTIREQMNSAQTNREYKAFLTEVNTLKADKDRFEASAIEVMEKVEQLRKQLDELNVQRADREKVRAVAEEDCKKRAEEIKDRLAELKTERSHLASDVPKDALGTFERLVELRGDDAMAHIEIHDRKRHEFNCGACMMTVPVEIVSGLLGAGRMARCVSCGCILYLSEEDAKLMTSAPSKR